MKSAGACRRICLYCGEMVRKVKQGEHIVPKSIGGVKAIPNVCTRCNNEVLSQLDNELATNTPIQTLIWEQLGRKSNEACQLNPHYNLWLEAHVLEGYEAPAIWPQLVLCEEKMFFFQDSGDAATHRYTAKLFYKLLKRAVLLLRAGTRRSPWIWQPRPILPSAGHYPPRVYVKASADQLTQKSHFICRYPQHIAQEWILYRISKYSLPQRLHSVGLNGSNEAQTTDSFELRKIQRALTKIGINLLSAHCSKTVVDRTTFASAIRFVIEDQGFWPNLYCSGFLRDEDIAHLSCPPRSHVFRLSYVKGFWILDCAFFGGALGATVSFPGPNQEQWIRLEVVVPLCSSNWEIRESPIHVPRTMLGKWTDFWPPRSHKHIQNPEFGISVKPRKNHRRVAK